MTRKRKKFTSVLLASVLLLFSALSGCAPRAQRLLAYQENEMTVTVSGTVGGVETSGTLWLAEWDAEGEKKRAFSFLPSAPESLVGVTISCDSEGRVSARAGGVSVELENASDGVGIVGIAEVFSILDEPSSISAVDGAEAGMSKDIRLTKLDFDGMTVWLSQDGFPVRIESDAKKIFIDVSAVG